MNFPRLKHEGWLYGLAFLLALGLRLYHLGTLPLTDSEAQWALQAWQWSQGKQPLLGSQVAYLVPTAALFFIFGSFNFFARLLPALSGSILVLTPLLFRPRLKPRPALILAFLLAMDPGLLALARQAGSPILALTFVLLAWGFWQQGKPRLAGLFGALAVLSGPAFWAGVLGLFIAWAIRQGVEPRRVAESAQGPAAKRTDWLEALKIGLPVLVLGSSLFFLSPNGLSAWLNALPEYVAGWHTAAGVGGGQLLWALLVYQPLAVVFAALAIGRGWRRGGRIGLLTLWLLVSLVLAVFYPAHQVSDLMWSLIPLDALAALEVAPYLRWERQARREVGGVTAFTVFLLLFAWLDLTGLLWTPIPSPQANLRIVLLIGALLLWVVSLLLIAAGWPGPSAQRGGVLGVLVVFGLYTLSAAWSAAELRPSGGPEWWTPGARPLQADLLLKSVNDLSDWKQGHRFALPVTLNGVDSPALQWLLRDHPLEVVEHLVPTATPALLLITPAQVNPGLEAAYRGQDFSWRAQPDWRGLQPLDALRWIALRVPPPSTPETIILWARQDIFLGSSHSTP